ncbi:MAG: DUF2155 domain-containing protein [Rhodospirillaceae bacterium]|nr:DUF2155 domain-containing protein [Rhodospirillaceae bacterium]MDD9914079.1 DUF2155 domain-containing protein [Rhodospirillaceae bacterium]MDD9925363.1 DUF2155 domain-containing protein [Rhodospirillaceae bacterium]
MKKLFGAILCLLLFAGNRVDAFPGDMVIMQGLDKVTARVSTFQAPLGATVRFGTLEITVKSCDRTPPEEPPESAVFLEVMEKRPDEPVTELFRGWMFSSSPALSALEHPVYDVWVLECQRTAAAEPEKSG